ncbi:NAD-P-binding protein [Trametes versicolor FP-101664 SS1]|uniref:NAD-P-binding protein n=1 Tax=Trametes versicolor (strain FP-101664) TaxID=717944 RepID=UPI00046219CB|nr:NAD-P-binding protein [Trametes versicolor FP-101664 SS1]EIW60916.1 NAD-P-binding protein [Trametes versicolor FP-101664 SS1]
MSGRYSVAIVGGTGRLGYEISRVFLDEYRTTFPIVRVLTRDPSTARAQHLASKGAMLQVLDQENVAQSLLETFIHADVVINALNVTARKALKRQVAEAAVKGGAKVYFLSEFGVDHRENDFPGYDHHDWDVKRELASHAREVARGTPTQVIAVYTGLFIELSLNVLGFDIDNNLFTCFGPSTQKVSFTSKADVGRALARLCTLALDPLTAPQVPDELRISGNAVTYEDVRDLIAEVKGVQKGEIKSEELEKLKHKLRDTPDSHVVEYIRVLMGEGKLDFSCDNANSLVNPAEAFWKWKSVADQHRERRKVSQ